MWFAACLIAVVCTGPVAADGPPEVPAALGPSEPSEIKRRPRTCPGPGPGAKRIDFEVSRFLPRADMAGRAPHPAGGDWIGSEDAYQRRFGHPSRIDWAAQRVYALPARVKSRSQVSVRWVIHRGDALVVGLVTRYLGCGRGAKTTTQRGVFLITLPKGLPGKVVVDRCTLPSDCPRRRRGPRRR